MEDNLVCATGALVKCRKRHSHEWVNRIVSFQKPLMTNQEYWGDHEAKVEAKKQVKELGFNGRAVVKYWIYA